MSSSNSGKGKNGKRPEGQAKSLTQRLDRNLGLATSIPPERLLRALPLQVLYSLRSERQLMEELKYNLLYRVLRRGHQQANSPAHALELHGRARRSREDVGRAEAAPGLRHDPDPGLGRQQRLAPEQRPHPQRGAPLPAHHGRAPRRNGPKRTYRWVLESLRTLRYELLNVPAKIATPGGRPELRLAAAPETQQRITRALERLDEAV